MCGGVKKWRRKLSRHLVWLLLHIWNCCDIGNSVVLNGIKNYSIWVFSRRIKICNISIGISLKTRQTSRVREKVTVSEIMIHKSRLTGANLFSELFNSERGEKMRLAALPLSLLHKAHARTVAGSFLAIEFWIFRFVFTHAIWLWLCIYDTTKTVCKLSSTFH